MSVIEYKFEQYKTLGPIIYKKEKYKLQVELLKLQEAVSYTHLTLPTILRV